MTGDDLQVDDGEPALAHELTFVMSATSILVRPLPVGDAMWFGVGGTEVHIFERKRSDDFLASMQDDRLYDELERMKTEGDYRWLGIEGQLFPNGKGTVAVWGQVTVEKTGWGGHASGLWENSHFYPDFAYSRVEAVLGKLAYWTDVRVLYSPTLRHMADGLARVYSSRATPPVTRLWRPNIELMKRDPIAASYMTIEGVGEATALHLAGSCKCKSHAIFVQWNDLTNATDKDILSVPGVGTGRLKAIRERVGK